MAGLPQGSEKNKRLMKPLVAFNESVGVMMDRGKQRQAQSDAISRGDASYRVSDKKTRPAKKLGARAGYTEEELGAIRADVESKMKRPGGAGGEGRRVG